MKMVFKRQFVVGYLCIIALAVCLSDPSLRAPVLTALVALWVGLMAVAMQSEILTFQRWANRSAIGLDVKSIESTTPVIRIENHDGKPANCVYVGSYLFSTDGMTQVTLYDEIAPILVKGNPIVQGDVLMPNWRSSNGVEDCKRYGSILKERWEGFVKRHHEFLLVIAIRDPLIVRAVDTPMYFFRCRSLDLQNLSFANEHFAGHTQFYKQVVKTVAKRYAEVVSEHEG